VDTGKRGGPGQLFGLTEIAVCAALLPLQYSVTNKFLISVKLERCPYEDIEAALNRG